MNPYAMLAQTGREPHRLLVEELQQWHDAMVMHQRVVRRLGPSACSDDCPHVEGRRLWKEAKALFGPAADGLTFLRACAGDLPKAKPAPAMRAASA